MTDRMLQEQLVQKYDYSNLITKEHQQNAIKLIDSLIKSGNWCKSVPRTQTYSNLFMYSEISIFKQTFLQSCFNYLKFKDYLNYGMIMWGYRDNIIGYHMKNKRSFWHKHEEEGKNKVSGILYLKNLGNEGTVFENFELNVEPNSWFIYPSYLLHRAGKIKSFRYRYTLAADFYY